MNSDATLIWVFIGVLIAIIIGMIMAQSAAAAKAEAERKSRIYAKYGSTPLAEKLVGRIIWAGETAVELRYSLGEPLDIDQKVLKTKKKEIWKYNKTGTNRYGLKVTLDNDLVVGWDQK